LAYALAEQLGTLLVFYRLEPWSDDQGTFRLTLADIDLPSKFDSAGRIQVWLLSEEKVVWSADVKWPGKQPAGQQPTLPKAPEPKPVKPQPVKPKATEPKAKPAPAPDPVVPKAAPTPEDKKPAVKDVMPKPPVNAPETGPALSPADKKPSLPSTVKRPAPVEPKKPVDIRTMTVDELTKHIEQAWGPTMSSSVRKAWAAGWHNYYEVVNPFGVRKAVFMSLLRTCHKEQPPGKLRDAFAILYLRLKESSQDPRKK